MKREIRSFKQELRTEGGDGKIFLSGYTALYNSLSQNLGSEKRPWKERIMPGAFTRALAEKQDVRHLINHDPSLILARSKNGTLVLSEDSTGLHYRSLLPDTSYAKDLAISVERGDVDSQSFGFTCLKDSWVIENGIDVRQLEDLSIDDVSTVTYPAYLGTSAGVETRMFPDGMPESVSAHTNEPEPDPAPEPGAECACSCDSCKAGTCSDCSNSACDDAKCTDCPYQMDMDDVQRGPTFKATAAIVSNAVRMLNAGPSERQEIRSAATGEDGVLELFVYEDIGYDECLGTGVSVDSIKQQIDQAGPHDRIRVRINSMGGDVFEGVAIYNLIRAQGKPVTTYIDGMAASIASIIAMAGDEIEIGPSAMMMVHNASCGAHGYASDLRQEADILDKVSGAIARTYKKVTGKSKAFIKDLMDNETWMDADDCIRDGFATRIANEKGTGAEERMAKAVTSSRFACSYRNLPRKFKETRAKMRRTRLVDGEHLQMDAFLVTPDASETRSWKLPYKLKSAEATRTHLINALRRFNQIEIADDIRAASWAKLVAACKEHNIQLTDEIRAQLTAEQIHDLEFDPTVEQAQVAARMRLRELQLAL